MKPSQLFLAVTTLALVLLFTLAVPSAIEAKPAPAPDAPPADRRILITAVDATAGTIELKYMTNQMTHTYKIDLGTTIKVNDAPGQIGDIKVGMQVRDSADRDDQTLDSISVNQADPAPAGEPTPKKKKQHQPQPDPDGN